MEKKNESKLKAKSSDFDSTKSGEEAKRESEGEKNEEFEKVDEITTNEDLAKFKSKLFSDLGLENEDIKEINKAFDFNEQEFKEQEEESKIREPMSNEIIDQIGNVEINDLFRSEAFDQIVQNSKDLFNFKKPKVYFELDVNFFLK